MEAVLFLADQMNDRIEYVYIKGFLACLFMDTGRHCDKLYLIDFSLANRMRQHIPCLEEITSPGLQGTKASINAHLSIQSKGVHMKSLSFVLLYFNSRSLSFLAGLQSGHDEAEV